MAGLRLPHTGDRVVLTPTFWVDPDEVPVLFVVVKDGATALAHPEYIGGTLYAVDNGSLHLEEAWDKLMIKTPSMDYPKLCELMTETLDTVTFLVDGDAVFKMEV